MATANITKRAVDAAKVSRADTYLWDRVLRGFGLKVTPAGSKVRAQGTDATRHYWPARFTVDARDSSCRGQALAWRG